MYGQLRDLGEVSKNHNSIKKYGFETSQSFKSLYALRQQAATPTVERRYEPSITQAYPSKLPSTESKIRLSATIQQPMRFKSQTLSLKSVSASPVRRMPPQQDIDKKGFKTINPSRTKDYQTVDHIKET